MMPKPQFLRLCARLLRRTLIKREPHTTSCWNRHKGAGDDDGDDPVESGAAGVVQAQERVIKFARQKVDAGLSLADELANAATFPEMLQIQSRHAQLQMQAYALHAKELTIGMNGANQNARQ